MFRLGLFLILNGNRFSDATCSLPTDLKNAVWEYNYTNVLDNSEHSTTLNIGTTTIQNSIRLDAYGTTMDDWTCINSLNISHTQTTAVFKSDTSFTSSPSSGNRRLYLCMKLTKVSNDLYYFYLLSDISNEVTPNERVFVSEEGNAPADDAPMCRTFCQYTGSPKIRTLRRQGTCDEVPGDAALCEPCDSTCEVDRCDPNPCQNNGSCTDFKENYNCTCTDGWKGENCTIDINECSNKKRATVCPLHSDCFNTVGSYGCNCKNGYQDKNGDCTDVNECERKPCPEHSNCTNTIGSFRCTCWIGYVNTSMGCQDRCDPNPCQNNGSCVDFKENYTCVCTDGWKGGNCTTDINECLDKQRTAMCPQHSDCLNTDGSYECNCKNGYQDTNGTCTGDKLSTEDKSTDLGSIIGLSVGIFVLLLVIIIVVFVKWKKRTRQSTFGVNSNTNSDGHKNVENELTEVEQNLVVKT